MTNIIDPVVAEYEVFKNDRDALAFFFFRHPSLDNTDNQGPFWFNIQDSRIMAGTEQHHAVFDGVNADVIETARERGVIMLVEFEDQQPLRCTPCYLADSF